MTFEKYLALKRGAFELRTQNPAGDVLARELDKHLRTVGEWLSGHLNFTKMLSAMQFFNEEFPGRYSATSGRLVYRGQSKAIFDGDPRSYSYDESVAEQFSCDPTMAKGFAAKLLSLKPKQAFVIRRKVCHTCADRAAFAVSLDLSKILSSYGAHGYGWEKEVVILNTKPAGKSAQVFEGGCQ